MNGPVINGVAPAGGMDGLSKRVIENATDQFRNQIMARGRQVFVCVVATDGPHGAVFTSFSSMDAVTADAFGQALIDKGMELRQQARTRGAAGRQSLG